MLGALTDKLQEAFAKLRGKKQLTEENISDAVRDVRLALLEADVHYGVVKTLIKRIKDKALGDDVLKSVTPGQQFVKCVHDELVALMGGEEVPIDLSGAPSVILLCGLQGSGKTTQAAKLAEYLRKNHPKKKVLLVACDLARPAAVEQLKTLGTKVGVEVYTEAKNPVEVAKNALSHAKREGFDVVIVDTAGRLHIDQELMEQLADIKKVVQPQEILFVANATIGQDAVNVAAEFNGKVAVTGTILTMLDGNARGGAAISIREVTGKPLKFEGIGETVGDLQPFNPTSMADRILGMGDAINLVRKAQEHFDEDQAKSLEKKIRSASFTYQDYLNQIQMVKKMGSFKSILGMLPGASQLKNFEFDGSEIGKVEAIILSMTEDEREGVSELIPGRRKRISEGSGRHIDDVNKLVKSFKQAKQFFKNSNKNQMKKLLGGGALWR